MIEIAPTPRVPARLVLLSLAALWACYFVVASLRGMFQGFDMDWPILSRRLTICILSMLLMAAVLPLLQMVERKSGGVRLAVVLIGALPLSLALSVVNDVVFADIDMTHAYGGAQDKAAIKAGNVRISRDEAGNILVDLPKPPTAPPPPDEAQDDNDAAAPPKQPTPTAPTVSTTHKGSAITIHTSEAMGQSSSRWSTIADNAFGRYFLVLAWAALYFALAKAEEARAAERREGEYRRAAEAAELRSLRYQVNPHFLFNTLNSLSALVMTGRQDDAEEMLQTLSTFYRRTLSGDPSNDMRLEDEIELQTLYFAIEAVRFPSRLLTKIDLDPALAGAMVPGMILQPLVENSVKYAVAATRDPVTVTIAAHRERGLDGDKLVLSVSDDGPGAERKEIDHKTEGFGIGLSNVRDRLRARYGEDATMIAGKRPEGGFATVLRIPLELGARPTHREFARV
ncbi:sensor histidine kinase [Novosphingobium sp. Rr 2-17]|uniref:sensor histidine kinase n=1 Tax=Novosphingobium sp. Rr 2-17 TaxID=555793 RepID=UPI000269AB7F|nr:histidine kinase [Novosphingobium sp. Rr 2-17]EIZ78408.1 sensor histidine kinase [Novosphingobium sp. Rr 2-17]